MSETTGASSDRRRPSHRRLSLFSCSDSDEIGLAADPQPLTADPAMDEEELTATALGQFRTEFYDQDLLTCGVCRRVFALSDILKFIRHKVKTCSAKKPGCSDRMNDGDEEEEEEEEVIDEDSSTPSPSPGSGEDPQSPTRVKSQTPSIINSSQRHKYKLIPLKQQSHPHHRSFIGNQSPFNHHHQTRKSPPQARTHHRSDKKTAKDSSPNSGQSDSFSLFLLSLSHSFHHCYYPPN